MYGTRKEINIERSWNLWDIWVNGFFLGVWFGLGWPEGLADYQEGSQKKHQTIELFTLIPTRSLFIKIDQSSRQSKKGHLIISNLTTKYYKWSQVKSIQHLKTSIYHSIVYKFLSPEKEFLTFSQHFSLIFF
jgi:hypothetical protein